MKRKSAETELANAKKKDRERVEETWQVALPLANHHHDRSLF